MATSKHGQLYTHTSAQCSPASMGLAQACPGLPKLACTTLTVMLLITYHDCAHYMYMHFFFAIILYAPLNPEVKSCGCSEIFSVGGGETTNTKGNRYSA